MPVSSFQPSSAYIPVRDDAGLKSLSRVERDFITTSCSVTSASSTSNTTASSSSQQQHRPPTTTRLLRTDGRAWNELRAHRLELLRWDQGASATIQWGSATKCHCTCTARIVPPPNSDRPAEGAIRVSVDLSPAASTSFRFGQPVGTTSSIGGRSSGVSPDFQQKLLTNRILRSLERILVLGGAIDTEALCVTPGHWVWSLSLAVTVLDAGGGNVLDACALACMAALRHYRKPQLESQQSQSQQGDDDGQPATSSSSSIPLPPKIVSADLKEPTPLPIHHTPLSVSFALLPRDDRDNNDKMAVLLDPNAREELALSSGTTNTLVIAMNVHGEICLLDFGGCEILPATLKQCANLASRCVSQTLCPALERALQEADDKALQERLERLQLQAHQGDSLLLLPPPPVMSPTGIPFWHQESDIQVNADQSADQATAALAQTQAEEALRRQALDYNLAHIPSKVRENKAAHEDDAADRRRQRDDPSSALLAALMKSVQASSTDAKNVSGKMETAQPMALEQTEPPAKKTQQKTTPVQDKLKAKVQAGNTYPQPSTKPAPPAVATLAVSAADARLDSDEEDVTMELASEFAMAPKSVETVPAKASAPVLSAVANDDEDVDDLAAAIKKKKKKSKK